MSWYLATFSLAVIGQAADWMTTMLGLDEGLSEANPIIRWMAEKTNLNVVLAYKIGTTIGVGLALQYFMGEYAAMLFWGLMAAQGFGLAAWNYRLIRRRRARNE